MHDEGICNRVVEQLKLSEIGLTVTETSKLARVQRITARKHLERLTREGRAKEVRKGRCRIFVLSVGEKNE